MLAELAQAAGDAAAARQCAQYARDLAPGWKAPRQFLARQFKGATRPDWLVLPPPIALDTQRLSVCVIAKNEEKFIGQCLASVKGVADQLIVVDTGSTDRTVEIARQHGAEVSHFEWCDDFSAARNAALEQARGDWVLVLDADEELPVEQHERLKADLRNGKVIASRLPLVNRGQEAEGRSYLPRLFRNAPGAYFRGRIHEQVFPSLIAVGKAWGLGTGLGSAQLLHYGYAKELVSDRSKIQRNLRLLRQAVEEDPDDPNLVMNLGLELVRSGDLEASLGHYRRAFALMSAQAPADIAPELREVLLTQFTSHLYKVRAHDEVVAVLTSPLARQGGLTASLHYTLGLSRFERKQYAEAAEQMRQCLAKSNQPALSPINTDILASVPCHCLALSLARTGDAPGAERAFQAGLARPGRTEELKLDYARFLAEHERPLDALQQLNELVAQNCRHAAAWRLGGQIALSRPQFLEFARDWTAEAIRCLPDEPALIAQRAEALLLSQDTAGAGDLWRRCCEAKADQHGSVVPAARIAALLLCDLVEGRPLLLALPDSEQASVTRAFIDWYRKCVAAAAGDVIAALHARTRGLAQILPEAARLIEAVIAEAARTTAPEPCAATA